MDDLISRQGAVEALLDLIDEIQEQPSYSREQVEAIDAAWRAICDLPSAEQPKIGKWIYSKTRGWKCAECFEPCAGTIMGKPRDRFCKWCGAKMEGTK